MIPSDLFHFPRLPRVLAMALFLAAPVAVAETGRDPASVPLPAETRLKLKLGAEAEIARYRAAFDAMAPTGALFLLGPNTTREIQAAADRARVFLLYQQYDLDGDGAVSRREYDRHADVTWGTDLEDAGRAVLEREWDRADGDRDGSVSAEELRALALSLHPVPPDRAPSKIELAIIAMDLDGDGFVYWDEVARVLSAN